jgi:hypothetical protein
MRNDYPPLWEAICRAAAVDPSSSVDRVHAAYASVVGRGTIQRIREGGSPRMESLSKMADQIGLHSVHSMLSPPKNRGALAHDMNPTAHDHPPLLTWEVIVNGGVLPKRFRCEVPDDALWSPTEGGTARGTPVVFVTTDQPPVPGTGVLVEDKHGERYVRIYRQALSGAWLAAARNPNYLTLDSGKHGLRLLAVAENRLLDGQL